MVLHGDATAVHFGVNFGEFGSFIGMCSMCGKRSGKGETGQEWERGSGEGEWRREDEWKMR